MVLQLTRSLNQLGCETTLGVFKNAHALNTEIVEAAQRYGISVEIFDCRGKIDRSTVRGISNFLLRHQTDILHTHGYKANSYGLKASKATTTKIVATSHNWPGKSIMLRAYAALDKLQLRYFDHICPVSEAVASALERALIPRRKITVVQNGIDVDRFSAGVPSLKESVRYNGKLVVGYVGRLVEGKGLDVLLRAAKELIQRMTNVEFVFVGEGPKRESLQTLAARLGVHDHVSFMGPRSDLPDLYASFDVFVLPSLREGMPLVVLEAMAARKPVVATRVGAIPTVVTDEQTGLLVHPGSAEELQRAIHRFLSGPDMCHQFGERGHDLVKRQFSSQSMAECYLTVYGNVLSRRCTDYASKHINVATSDGQPR
jgi:glycosyltransferase involved in cell wall biosynthesis